MQSIVGGGQPSVSRRPIKHESSGFSFLLHLLPDACQPTNLLVSSLAAIIIDPRTYHASVSCPRHCDGYTASNEASILVLVKVVTSEVTRELGRWTMVERDQNREK